MRCTTGYFMSLLLAPHIVMVMSLLLVPHEEPANCTWSLRSFNCWIVPQAMCECCLPCCSLGMCPSMSDQSWLFHSVNRTPSTTCCTTARRLCCASANVAHGSRPCVCSVKGVNLCPSTSAAWHAQADVQVVAPGEDAGLALAVVLLHADAVLVLEDGGEHEPVVLHALTEIVLLVQSVVACWAHLHACDPCTPQKVQP
jgi:hypothetical protein